MKDFIIKVGKRYGEVVATTVLMAIWIASLVVVAQAIMHFSGLSVVVS